MVSIQKIGDKALSILTSRLSFNIIIWLFIVDGVYNYREHDIIWLQNSAHAIAAVVIHLMWFALIYGNTSILLPRLLLRKKIILYFLAIAAHATLFTLLIGWYSEWLIFTFPGPEKIFYFFIATPTRAAYATGWDYYWHVFLNSVLPTLFLFSMGRLMLYFFSERKKNAIMEKKQLESELLLLKSQVNPHFLFNVLNSIYSFSLKDSRKTPEMILKLSHLLRYMLYESRQDYVPLAKELEMLTAYIDIERIRLKNKEAIQVTLPSAPVQHYMVAPALLIFFVENAVKHGIESMAGDAFVRISVSLDGNRLHFYCVNNYESKTEPLQAKEHAGGIGLHNVAKRLELIYPGRHDLKITDHNQTFEIALNLKLNTHDDLPDHR